jgi:hypothetical protein
MPPATNSNRSDPARDFDALEPDASDAETLVALWLSDIASLETSGDQPMPPPAPRPRIVEREFYVGAWAADGKGGRVKFGPNRTVRVIVPEPEPG